MSPVNILECAIRTIHRWWYLVATYAGIRAVANGVLSRFAPLVGEIAMIQGLNVSSERLGDIVVFVHSRRCPPALRGKADFGMISMRLEQPKIPRLLYWYFCRTSHFGVGHMEVAFYQQGRRVTIHAVRNTARSNASRLGLRRIADKLMLVERDEEVQVVLAVAELLENHGFVTRLARSDECVNLSVSRRLLDPAAQTRTLEALQRSYELLHRKLRQEAQNGASIRTFDPSRVQSVLKLQTSNQESECVPGQA